jgi:hypothetical protein
MVEWAEGATPRADDPHFAGRLGEALAALYRVEFRERPKDELILEFETYARELEQVGRLSDGSNQRLTVQLNDALPNSVPTSTLCGDQTLANFVIGADGSLHMIDPGSFQSNLPIDIFPMGGELYGSVDRNAFHAGYTHARGIDFPFLHARPLELMQRVRRCALRCRVLDHTSSIEARRKRNLKRSIDQKLAQLRMHLS